MGSSLPFSLSTFVILIRLALCLPCGAGSDAGLSLAGSTVITYSRPGESWIVISVAKVGPPSSTKAAKPQPRNIGIVEIRMFNPFESR